MFASRLNQENAVYEQQTAAAAKPANQGLKGLAPKTPGNKAPKTPFKNDENARIPFGGKTGGKGKQDGGDGGKPQRDAFVTPAGPRTRAPLGQKTTNAKAGAGGFRAATTPSAAQPQSTKHRSRRHRRGLLKIHEAVATETEEDAESHLPEIEHMPPRGQPLPDHPDDVWPAEREYPQFEGANFTRGWASELGFKRRDEDDASDDGFDDFQAALKDLETRGNNTTSWTKTPASATKPKIHKPTLQRTKTDQDPLASSKAVPSTLASRSAASALSSNPSATKPSNTASSRTPSFAAPTAATKARVPSVPASRKVALSSRPTSSSSSLSMPKHSTEGNARHTAAKAASKNTLGYAKGRAVSGAGARGALSGVHARQADVRGDGSGQVGEGTTLDKLLGLNLGRYGNGNDDQSGDLGVGHDVGIVGVEEESEEPFQLDEVVL